VYDQLDNAGHIAAKDEKRGMITMNVAHGGKSPRVLLLHPTALYPIPQEGEEYYTNYTPFEKGVMSDTSKNPAMQQDLPKDITQITEITPSTDTYKTENTNTRESCICPPEKCNCVMPDVLAHYDAPNRDYTLGVMSDAQSVISDRQALARGAHNNGQSNGWHAKVRWIYLRLQYRRLKEHGAEDAKEAIETHCTSFDAPVDQVLAELEAAWNEIEAQEVEE
jgi:hypothetical protein